MKQVTTILLLLAAPAVSQTSLFSGPPGGIGDVWVVEQGGTVDRPAELQGILLLPIDCVGRTRFGQLLPTSPRLRDDIPGATRIELPGNAGSLYRYRRAEDPGADRFGFLVVGIDGRARSVFELDGSGPGGIDDPVPGKVGLAADGSGLVVATTLAAGGDLYQVEFASPVATNRSGALPPTAFLENGLALCAGFGVGLTSTGPLRFDRASPGDSVPVAFPAPLPIDFAPDVVTDPNGAVVAVLGGATPTARCIYVFGRAGQALGVSGAPADLPAAGFLPEYEAGPFLALSPNGGHVAWRAIEGPSSELFVRESGIGAASQHVTADANFTDTLNETGMIGFVSALALIALVGERTPGGGIEGADFFGVDLSGGPAAISNLTATSGDTLLPFLQKGEIGSEDGVFAIPGSTDVLFHWSQSGGGGELWRADLAAGTTNQLLDDVKSLDLVEHSGGQLFLEVRRSTAGSPHELLGLSIAAATLSPLGRTGDAEVLRWAADTSGNVAAIAELLGPAWLGRVDLASGVGGLLTPTAFVYGPTLTFAPDGSIVSSVSIGASDPIFFAWPPAGPPRRLVGGSMPGFVLPGP